MVFNQEFIVLFLVSDDLFSLLYGFLGFFHLFGRSSNLQRADHNPVIHGFNLQFLVNIIRYLRAKYTCSLLIHGQKLAFRWLLLRQNALLLAPLFFSELLIMVVQAQFV